MLQLNLIRTGFLLGISLLLAAIIYFFAANWAGMERMEKVTLSAGLVALFYLVTFLLTKLRFMQGTHSSLSRLFLVAGCISFGVGVALLDQIYNSTADSYILFMVWSVPAILFAIITRNSAFYMLSFILVHITLMQYFFPSFGSFMYSEGYKIGVYSLFAILNICLFIVIEKGWIQSTVLKIFSFIVLHIALLALSNSFALDTYGVWLNPLSIAAIAISFYYFIRVRVDKLFLTLNALAASAFAVLKFIELAESFFSFTFYLFGLLFVALLLTGNVVFFNFIKKLTSVEVEGETEDQAKDGRVGEIVGKIVSTIVIIVGVIIGTISLSGLVAMLSVDADPEDVLFVFSLLFVLPMLFIPRINAVVRYTVLTIGYLSGIGAIIWHGEVLLSSIYLILAIVGWIRLEGRFQRLFTYTILNINMIIVLFQWLDFNSMHTWTYILLIVAIVNTCLYACHSLLADSDMKVHLRESSLYTGLFFIFLLTFMEDIFTYSYAFFNVLNFLVLTWLLFQFIKRERAVDTTLTLILWFAFLVYKYYDLLWKLLHKSFTMALLGLIMISITYIFASRAKDRNDATPDHPFLLRKQGLLILLIIVLQFGYLGYKVAVSEQLLTNGSVVKLELQPIDPRSLLQGDYVQLGYSISQLPEDVNEDLEEREIQGRIQIVLSEDEQGIHIFNRMYTDGESLAPNEIVINGKKPSYSWNQVDYGIENYFIPEGTGREVEENAKFAYVRIGVNGNAMLERLSDR